MKTLNDYELDIKKYHDALIDYPDNKNLKNKLNYRLGAWQALLDITYFIASNEQTPWDLNEYNTTPMPLKRVSGHHQVGDYAAYINDYVMFAPLLVERKGGGASDLYGTLMSRDARERFYRECERFQADPRFSQLIIIAECTLQDFLTYAPKFNGKRYNSNHASASVESRRATIAGLFARSVPVLFAGSRQEAQKTYLQLVRQSCIKNYKSILKIDV